MSEFSRVSGRELFSFACLICWRIDTRAEETSSLVPHAEEGVTLTANRRDVGIDPGGNNLPATSQRWRTLQRSGRTGPIKGEAVTAESNRHAALSLAIHRHKKRARVR